MKRDKYFNSLNNLSDYAFLVFCLSSLFHLFINHTFFSDIILYLINLFAIHSLNVTVHSTII